MGKVLTKPGVNFELIAPEGFVILGAIERASRVFDVNLTLTSAFRNDARSMHGQGKAFDVRTVDLLAPTILGLYYWFRAELGPGYTVLYEAPSTSAVHESLRGIVTVNSNATGPHFHIQVKRA